MCIPEAVHFRGQDVFDANGRVGRGKQSLGENGTTDVYAAVSS